MRHSIFMDGKTRDRNIASLLRSWAFPLAAMLVGFGAYGQAQSARIGTRDGAIQAEIRSVIHALGASDRDPAMAALAARRAADPLGLTTQLFLYSADAQSTRDGMALAVLSRALALDQQMLVNALVPYFEVEDEFLRTEAAGVLAEFEGAELNRAPSFAIYHAFLEPVFRAGGEPGHGLIRHLFEVDPGTALLFLMRMLEHDAAEQRSILWAEHVLADSIWKREYGFSDGDQLSLETQRQLSVIQRHPRWWVRLYAAAILNRHPFLAKAEGLDLLRRDVHPLVRRMAN